MARILKLIHNRAISVDKHGYIAYSSEWRADAVPSSNIKLNKCVRSGRHAEAYIFCVLLSFRCGMNEVMMFAVWLHDRYPFCVVQEGTLSILYIYDTQCVCVMRVDGTTVASEKNQRRYIFHRDEIRKNNKDICTAPKE